MVTTTCKELAGKECAVPITGNSYKELQDNVFKHAKQHHPDDVKKMSPQEQTRMIKRIEDIYNQKAGATASR